MTPYCFIMSVMSTNTAAFDRTTPTNEQSRTANGSSGSARTVEGIYRSAPFHWVGNGFYVSSYFPRPDLPAERVSPFLLMDYGPSREFSPLSNGQRGVGWHPHRGFETVTVAWEGAVAHRDNAGNAGIIGPGDVQWMTAGAGILHEEYHEREFARAGGRVHMTQLWVNLPKKDKMTAPGYQPITAAQVPTVTLADGAGTVRVIAGEYGGAAGPARTFTPITMLDARLAAGGRLPVRLPSTHNALAIVTDGRVRVGTRHATAGELVLFENDGAELDVLALEETHLLVLAGEPIDEPITQYGPFVMNTPAEIQQAFVDFRQGKFGDVPE
jgi:redox-sensitive bicupin YhaK (pirin superfamily)